MHCSNRHCWGPGQQEVRITQLPTHGIKVAQIYADRGGSRKGGNGLSGDTSPRLKPPVPGGTEGKRYSRKSD